MNTLQGRAPQTKTQPSLEYYIRHSLNLLWRWKWYISIITPVVFLGLTALTVKYVDSRPELESRATLQFSPDGGGIGRIDEQAAALQQSSCDAFLRSRQFLENVVEKLSLRCAVAKYFRNEILDSISIEKNATPGQYDFVIENDSYTLYFTNKRRDIVKRMVVAGKLFELNSFTFPSVSLKLTHDFITDPHNFTFFISSLREAVDKIRWSFQVTFPGAQERQTPVMIIALRGKDYPLVTQIINVIADDFVDYNASMNRSKKSGVVDVLERQLQEARSSLAGADEAMRQFREANPSVGAISTLSSSVNEVANLEGTSTSINRSIDEAVALQARCKGNATLEDQLTTMFEAITFLTTRQSVAAPALQLELNEVSAEKRRVDADYAPQHPLVIENRKKITRVASNISKALAETIDKMRSESLAVNSRKKALSDEFQKLPSKELRYAELERRRSIAAELYSNVLTRYNANKMSAGSQGNDIFVLDHAVVPIIPGRIQNMLQLLLLGLAIAIGVGIAPPVGVDYFDKRARNEDDCRRFTTLPFLEGIPVAGNTGKKKKADREKIDSLLVAGSFEPGVFDEMHRSLRTKILLHLHDEKNKMLVVTSLNVGDGKSLTAANLSIVMAQQKLRTLLIDGDLRRGVQHHSFVLQKSPGLSEILSSPDDLTTMPINSMIQQAHIPNLSLLSCGMPVPNPAECMNSQKFRDLTTMLAEWFDVIVLDTPPLRVAVDAAILPEVFKYYIVVVRAAKTNLVAVEKKIGEFPGLRKKILGIVLNGAPVDKKARNYRYSYYRT
jgi:polysaccharide biosynthesis transport protein